MSDQTILTLHKRVITHNARIHVTHDEQRTWNLLIKNVQPEDEGCYMCQINTAVMKKELGCISVQGSKLACSFLFFFAAAAYYSPPFHTVRIWVEKKNSVILGRLREYFKKPSFLYCLHIFS